MATSDGGEGSIDLIESAPNLDSPDAFELCLKSEMRGHLAEAIATLSEREQLVLSLYYREELTMKEIAEVVGVALSRVSQIRVAAIAKLRAAMEHTAPREQTGRAAVAPARRTAVGDLGHDGQALPHGRSAVVGDAQGPDELVVELVVAEALHPDGTADDIGVFEGHGALFLGRDPGWARSPLAGHFARDRTYPVSCVWPPSRPPPVPIAPENLEPPATWWRRRRRPEPLVVLPEYFLVAGAPEVSGPAPRPWTGPRCLGVGRWPAHGIHLVAGSFPETPGRPRGRLSNTSCLFGPDGALLAVYRKIHLFDVALRGVEFRESATIAPATDLVVLPVAGADDRRPAVLGLSLCYDVRFPELYRMLALAGPPS